MGQNLHNIRIFARGANPSTATPLLDISVEDNSYRYKAIMGDNTLTLYYKLAEHIELPIGAFCIFGGETYELLRPESLKMKHSREFEYTLILESPAAKTKLWKVRNTIDGRIKFTLTAQPQEHLAMLVSNLNRRDSGWEVGECITAAEKTISYDCSSCAEALAAIATEYVTEYEIIGKTIHLHKVEHNKSNPLPLSYGRGNGFKSGVGRSNYSDNPPVEILFVQGGDRNIDPSSYGNNQLLLPKGQVLGFDGEHFSDQVGYNPNNARTYQVSADGISIEQQGTTPESYTEDSLDCSEIYPKREGQVSSVIIADQSKNLYDIIDNTIPATLDYKQQLMEGETMSIIFQSGMLAGREFDVNYIHEERKFEIKPEILDGQEMPSPAFPPAVGDKYIVVGCTLPPEYIGDNATKSGAEWEMFRAAVKYKYDNEQPRFTFKGELDGIWAKKNWEQIGARILLGGFVRFTDERFQAEGIDIRIVGIKDYINNPTAPEIELSNNTISAGFSSTIKQLEATEVLNEQRHAEAISYTKRRWRDTQETMQMLEDALLNFTGSISPITVRTMQMIAGDESLQFRFVNNSTNPQPVAHLISYNQATKQLTAQAGLLQHMTLGIDNLAPSHAASEYRFWNLPAYTSGTLFDGTKGYYLYAKVAKSGSSGEFLLSESAIAMEQVSGYYHLLVGLLNSEYEEERSFASLYGYTEVLPGRVTTDKIISTDGQSFFDMLNNAMRLGDNLEYNTDGNHQLVLKGTLVQSQSGQREVIGTFLGAYEGSRTYYLGDEVTYTANGSTSTYRYINGTPAAGVAPTTTTHWKVVAQGAKGEQGNPGIDGADGTNGETSYLHIKYSNDGGQTFTGKKGLRLVGGSLRITSNGCLRLTDEHIGEEIGSWIGQYVDFNEYDSLDNWRYKWSKIQGEDGQDGQDGVDGADGKDGAFFETVYRLGSSLVSAPYIERTAPIPSNWFTEPPTPTTAEPYLWWSTAKKSAAGALLQNWSLPQRTTPRDGVDGQPGGKGDKGDRGISLVCRGDWESSKTYTSSDYAADVVKYGSTWYIAKPNSSANYNKRPDQNPLFWEAFGANFESVATNVLWANMAWIGSFHFNGREMYSQQGTGSGSSFVPNIEIDGDSGEIRSGGDVVMNKDGLEIIKSNAKTLIRNATIQQMINSLTTQGSKGTFQIPNYSTQGIQVSLQGGREYQIVVDSVVNFTHKNITINQVSGWLEVFAYLDVNLQIHRDGGREDINLADAESVIAEKDESMPSPQYYSRGTCTLRGSANISLNANDTLYLETYVGISHHGNGTYNQSGTEDLSITNSAEWYLRGQQWTLIGNNGICIFKDGTYIEITNNGTSLNADFRGLPTTKPAQVGRLWVDIDGTLKLG